MDKVIQEQDPNANQDQLTQGQNKNQEFVEVDISDAKLPHGNEDQAQTCPEATGTVETQIGQAEECCQELNQPGQTESVCCPDQAQTAANDSQECCLEENSSLPRGVPLIAQGNFAHGKRCHILVVVGASGDLAKKLVYPALWELYKRAKLPDDLFIIGYARSDLQVSDVKSKARNFIALTDRDNKKFQSFWAQNGYVPGSYSDASKTTDLLTAITTIEQNYEVADRTFYVALPPSVYKDITDLIKGKLMSTKGRTKIALEKPFGTDLETSEELDKHISSRFKDQEIARIDHYLNLEMVQAILVLRFSNRLFLNTWNNKHIESVLITFKEDFGTQGRGGYFDKAGIIRDVMQNHLLQVLALLAMERPHSLNDEDIRHEKTKLIRKIRPVEAKDIILGQYVGDQNAATEEAKKGYKDDHGVPQTSMTPTFATIVFHIDNERWNGVPFIMRAGKATNETKDEIRMQMKPLSKGTLLNSFNVDIAPNEYIIQLKPKEKLALRLTGKVPGLGNDLQNIELDLNYAKNVGDGIIGPYERVLLSLIQDSASSHFVGRNELRESWKLFTPIIKAAEGLAPHPYVFGSLGPREADDLCADNKFKLSKEFPW